MDSDKSTTINLSQTASLRKAAQSFLRHNSVPDHPEHTDYLVEAYVSEGVPEDVAASFVEEDRAIVRAERRERRHARGPRPDPEPRSRGRRSCQSPTTGWRRR